MLEPHTRAPSGFPSQAQARPAIARGELEREAKRIFRRLQEEGAHLMPLEKDEAGLFVARNRWAKPVMRVSLRLLAAFLAEDWLNASAAHTSTAHGRAGGADNEGPPLALYRLSEAGLAWYRRSQAPEDGFRAQHQLRVRERLTGAAQTEAPVTLNAGESPLGWLRRRRGPGGRPFIDEAQYEAGEKLRRDFTLAALTPSVTRDWSMALPSNARQKGVFRQSEISDMALEARRRFEAALAEAGPGLSDLLIEVCCHLQGLESAERGFGWPQRSGKVVLRLALERLALHYGLRRKERSGKRL
jgi:hypothetical protein